MRLLYLELYLHFIALCLDFTNCLEDWSQEIEESLTSAFSDVMNTENFEFHEPNKNNQDSNQLLNNETANNDTKTIPTVYFRPNMNKTLYYRVNQTITLECVAEKGNLRGYLTITDPNSDTDILNNTENLTDLTVSWKRTLDKHVDGKVIVCKLQIFSSSGNTYFTDKIENVTLKLINPNPGSEMLTEPLQMESKILKPEYIGAIAAIFIVIILFVLIMAYIRKKQAIKKRAQSSDENIYEAPYSHYAELNLPTNPKVLPKSEETPYAQIMGVLKKKSEIRH